MQANISNQCHCEHHKKRPIKLTSTILECWQREFFQRPYNHLKINKTFFEARLHREFNTEDLEIITKFLGNKNLIKLELSYFEIPKDVTLQLYEQFANILKSKSEVHLVHVNLPADFFRYFFKYPKCSKLVIIHLRGTPIDELSGLSLQYFLIQNKTLKYLDVGSCCLTTKTFPLIADGINKSKSLKGLDISRIVMDNDVSFFDTSKLALIVSQLLWKNQLVELHIKDFSFNSFDMEIISEYLAKENSVLKYLDLGSNNIGPDGVRKLFDAIIMSKSLNVLDLSSNSFGNDGGEIIGFMLPQTRIQHLSITNNRIGESGMYLILSTVKKPSQLKTLHIYGNEFSPRIAHMLRRQIDATTLLSDSIDVDIVFHSQKNEFYLTPKIKLPQEFSQCLL